MPTTGHLLSQFHSGQEVTLLFINKNLWLLEHQLATKKGQIACYAICLTCYINVNIAVVGTRSPKKRSHSPALDHLASHSALLLSFHADGYTQKDDKTRHMKLLLPSHPVGNSYRLLHIRALPAKKTKATVTIIQAVARGWAVSQVSASSAQFSVFPPGHHPLYVAH